MSNPNIAATSVIRGKTDVLAATTTSVSITSNGTASSMVFKVNTLTLCNVQSDGASTADASVDLYRGGSATKVANVVSIPYGATLVAINKTNPIYLLEGDSLRVVAGSVSSVHAVCSYEEIS